jgi:hypothetical protein
MESFFKRKTDKLDILSETMYNMFLEGTLPHLDMEHFAVMWKALIEKLEIDIDDEVFDAFIEDINSKASDRWDYFTNVFNTYFKK